MVTKEELETGFNLMVASVLGAGQRKITEYMKRKGVTQDTIDKAKEAADSLVSDLFDDKEEGDPLAGDSKRV
jgi:hypothetical protein